MEGDLRPWVRKTPLWMLITLAWVVALPVNIFLSIKRSVRIAMMDTVLEIHDLKLALSEAKGTKEPRP